MAAGLISSLPLFGSVRNRPLSKDHLRLPGASLWILARSQIVQRDHLRTLTTALLLDPLHDPVLLAIAWLNLND
jgi:hypothetical protein